MDIIYDSALQEVRQTDSIDLHKAIVVDGIPVRVLISADTFPPATAERVGIIALYTGSSTPEYNKGDFYRCMLVDGTYQWKHLEIDAVPVGECSDIRCITQGTTVRLKWRDPADLYEGDVLVSQWDRTLIVRKAGSAPQHFNDGTLVATNTVRNQYASTAFVDTIPDESVEYHYGFFTFSKEDAWMPAGEAVTGELTWAAIQDLTRSGEASQYFSVGDALTITMSNQQMTDTAQYDLEFAAFNTCTAADMEFIRKADMDSGTAKAWWNAESAYLLFTSGETPVSGDTAFYDVGLTIPTATVVALGGGSVIVTPSNCTTMYWKQSCEAMQFCPPEKLYGLTWDTHYRPDFRLAVYLRGSATATYFIIDTNEPLSGTDRVYWSLNGTYKLYRNANTDRWEIWQTNGGSHQTTGTTVYDYQTAGTADPTSGTWSSATIIADAKAYYKKVGYEYVELVAGTDYTAGEAISGEVYEKNQSQDRVNYGYNRWSVSPLRKYLNAVGMSWYEDGTPFSNEPGYAQYHGFLERIPVDLARAIGRTKVLTAINTNDSGGGSEYTVDKIFLASRKEVFGQNEDSGVAEGVQFPLYVGATDADRQKYLVTGQQAHYWLRSPFTGDAIIVRFVYTSGTLSNDFANFSIGVAPACNLI